MGKEILLYFSVAVQAMDTSPHLSLLTRYDALICENFKR